jgi:uncharacterized membrane protein
MYIAGGYKMKKLIKCKVCGFVGVEGEIKKICPACAAPITAFEEFENNISDERRMKLNLHIHPILVHFPQSLASLSLVFIVIAFITEGQIGDGLLTTEKILSIVLPFSVVAAMIAGLFDAKTRFTRKFGPLVKQKILLGIILLLSSTASAVLINQESFDFWGKTFVISLGVVIFACSALLGKKGGLLLEAKTADQISS